MDLSSFENWSGSRSQLIDIIAKIEGSNPKEFGLVSKTGGHLLPIKPRRIQQFIDLGIMPKPEASKSSNGKLSEGYDFEHISRYFAAIKLRKKKYTLEQAAAILLDLTRVEVTELLSDSENSSNRNFEQKAGPRFNGGTDHSKELRKLGRKEGKVIKSDQMLFAVTPWCHLHVSKAKFDALSEEEVEVIIAALAQSMRSMKSRR